MNVLLLGPLWRNEPIKRFLEEHGNTVVAYNDEINTELVEQHAIDIILSSGYGPIIKEPIVSRYHNKIYNLHATYLPYGKGIGTTFFSVFEGSPTGVSIHYIDAYIDTGDILFRRAVEYTTDDTLRTFYHTLLAETEKLFIEHWNEIADRDYTPMQQETLGIEVPYRSRVDSERFMDLLPAKWDTPLNEIEALGADFLLGEDFWDWYDAEVS